MRRLSAAQARRLAVAAQGLSRAAPPGVRDRRALRRVVERHTRLLQIDSVNVVARAHFLPVFSRAGHYPVSTLEDMAYRHRGRELFEYWGHEAALLPMALQPLMRWRMAAFERRVDADGRIGRLVRSRPGYLEEVYEQVRERGAVSSADLAAGERPGTEHWGWNWTDAKTALEHLFAVGAVSTSSRVNFARRYDLAERVLPPAVLAAPTPTPEAAHRELLLAAAGAHGVATLADLADYFRLTVPQARPRVAELVADGRLEPTTVEGWDAPAYTLPGVVVPRRVAGRALLVPFDPLVWRRERVERLFGVRYRIEIYVPAEQRVHGYYVLPFLLGDTLVARVDLKSDRGSGVLRVQASHAEPAAPPETAEELAAALRSMASWLGLGNVAVSGAGDLAGPLAAAVRADREP